MCEGHWLYGEGQRGGGVGGWPSGRSGASQQKLKYDSKNCPATRDLDERTAVNRSPTALITSPSMLGGNRESAPSCKFFVISSLYAGMSES